MKITRVEDESFEIQGWQAFEEKYKPRRNHISGKSEERSHAFEPYGAEVEYVKAQPNNHIWTRLQAEDSEIVVPGLNYVNRVEYYVTEVPWTDEDESVLLAMKDECECYNEHGYENGEYGKPDCELCEGVGYVTQYL